MTVPVVVVVRAVVPVVLPSTPLVVVRVVLLNTPLMVSESGITSGAGSGEGGVAKHASGGGEGADGGIHNKGGDGGDGGEGSIFKQTFNSIIINMSINN